MKNDFDGFSVKLFLDEDSDWLAHFIELPAVSAWGSSPEAAVLELKTAWKVYKESCEKEGDPIPIASNK